MSGKIFVGQPFKIRLNTRADLTTATSLQIRIKYPKTTNPDLIVDAALVAGCTSIIEADISSEDNTIAGGCEFWAWLVFPGDVGIVPGSPFSVTIYPL